MFRPTHRKEQSRFLLGAELLLSFEDWLWGGCWLDSAKTSTVKKPLEGWSVQMWRLTWTLKLDEEPRPEPSWRLEGRDRRREGESLLRCCLGCSRTSPLSAPSPPPGSFRSASELPVRLRCVGRIGWIRRPLTGLEHNRHLYSRLEQKGRWLAGLLGPALPVWRFSPE